MGWQQIRVGNHMMHSFKESFPEICSPELEAFASIPNADYKTQLSQK